MKYIVKTIVSESHGFYLCSLVYTGLSSLARQGIIRHHYLAPEDATRESQHFHACSVWMEVECQYTPLKRKICIELHDRSDFVATGLLEACDVYYKRSYFQPDLNSLSEWQRRKIKPFGLLFPCRSSESLTDLMCAIGPRLARQIPSPAARCGWSRCSQPRNLTPGSPAIGPALTWMVPRHLHSDTSKAELAMGSEREMASVSTTKRTVTWPEGRAFAFTVFDDTDPATPRNIGPV